MSYIKLKEQISKLYSQLDNFNSNSNQTKKKIYITIIIYQMIEKDNIIIYYFQKIIHLNQMILIQKE